MFLSKPHFIFSYNDYSYKTTTRKEYKSTHLSFFHYDSLKQKILVPARQGKAQPGIINKKGFRSNKQRKKPDNTRSHRIRKNSGDNSAGTKKST